ncbi:hypothetical protein A2331_06250 [Candidatus Falkowbacteria bacterium RIFOXYB2_FULL_34_18]|uniref:tRNA carboxymethyluridine synthase n=1 Tax=Candidatus Falkowbacteria bacterium RIFOXYD2_FULL_34_120 TaxID=1798007 RepID=A0A1F5TNK4_9BACT|nr:MAG: hypothetical protein A2331_06250 [Candidatus Falkowbacteria bacterium RIFOXYB2_FULL_34_18]OGF28766.1 MAG: hypothetical protein A2500_04450 [Candidatus Falkowbacteria bacterium RIFOXYC12_FULL_34_55]OGF35706.1 MAG: hypothetical protein A2466_05110 [Candidatus Falkowbacteria bacterium RIFOXYC2_FULL_34_220]OGF38422.1 MAG: hypothetical protein A2515_00605 [Candidatus Falkowbacteria bacterium RIFOXYD12_FULL_34_57]OGF40476.1 MAG: hypothetical protein A2531_03080 [Candidatus Falkowbacteria bact
MSKKITKKLNNIQKTAILELLRKDTNSKKDLMVIKRKIAKKYNISILSGAEILTCINNQNYKHAKIKKLLTKRAVRTISGIAPVAVLTKPYNCPGKCTFCPTEKNVPQSYLSNEPAVMRAIRCNYNPYTQVQDRLRALIANGHEPTKIELIVIGGTWSYLPEKYKYWYILNLFAGANKFREKSQNSSTQGGPVKKLNKKLMAENQYKLNLSFDKLKQALTREQKKNESAKYRIIGLTLETRPDYINEKELIEMRKLGCTRVEIGVQAIDDKILKLNKRGHTIQAITDATKLLKDFGFKVTYHLMPGLPGSTPKKDIQMFSNIFSDSRFQPDQIKFYPTIVTRGSLIFRWWKTGKYKPYSAKILRNIIIQCKKIIPDYVRIIRLIRDIPGESIIAGNKITNLRQIIKDEGVQCGCIRCREVRDQKFKLKNVHLFIKKYEASGGQEYFISYESEDKKTLYGFCRLRLSKIAIIRELHVYGELVSIGRNKKVQHSGLGKKLLSKAEKITKENKYRKISIISGVGVRGYYRKLGYKLQNTYMVKNI